MKKALALLMIAGLAVTMASAEITFNGWGRGLFVPVENSGASGEKSAAFATTSWGGNPRVGLGITGKADKVGFEMNIDTYSAIGIHDQQKIWVKPVDMLTLSVGKVFDDTLRGNAVFGAWDWLRGYSAIGKDSEGLIFERVDTQNGGVAAALAPTKEIYIDAALRNVGNGDSPTLTKDLGKNIQIGAGYTIAGVGLIRAQYISDYTAAVTTDAVDKYEINQKTGTIVHTQTAASTTDAYTKGVFEAAFRFTGVPKLYADVGYRMNAVKNTKTIDYNMVSAYANYQVTDALKVHGLVYSYIFGENQFNGKKDAGVALGAGVDYALADGFGVNADVRYLDKPTVSFTSGANASDAKTSYMLGVTKGLGNGLIGAGVEVLNGADTGYAIPVRFEYWF